MTDTNDSNGGNVVSLFDDDEVDRKILALRLAGVSIRKIGREYSLSDKQVNESLDRSLPTLSDEMRIQLFKIDLQRLDELTTYWWQQAKSGSAVGTTLVVKLMERRSQMLGSDVAPHMRVQVIQQGAGPQEGSTQLLIAEIERIAAEKSGVAIKPAPGEWPAS
jgi:hypothetical protein